MPNFESFLLNLSDNLPDICADKDLIKSLPQIFKSHCTISRMRERGMTPAYFYIKPQYYYLKDDVISWFKSRYNIQNKEVNV